VALTASELIDDAVGLAFPYIAEYAIARGPLLRQLTALDQEVAVHYATHFPERFLGSFSSITAVTDAHHTSGLEVSTNSILYARLTLIDVDDFRTSIRIVPESQFYDSPAHPSGIIRQRTFFPCDPLKKRWEGSEEREFYRVGEDSIEIQKIDVPTKLTTLAQSLSSPDEARQYFVQSLALTILLQGNGVPQERLQYAAALVASAKNDLGLLAAHATGSTSHYGGN